MRAIIVALLLLCSGAAQGDTIVEVGAGFLSWQYSEGNVIMVTERFADKYDIGIGLTQGQVCKCWDFVDSDILTPVDPLALLYAQRIFTVGRFEFGLGFGFWDKPSRVSGSVFTFPLSIKYRMYKQLYIGVRHFSNGSTAKPNLGQDMATLSWRFGK